MQATLIKQLSGWRGQAALYQLSESYQGTTHVVVSAVDVFGKPETYIFPSDSDGRVSNYGELPGSFQGALDHDRAIAGFIEAVSR